MMRRHWLSLVVFAAAGAIVAGGVVVAQDPLKQLGLTDAKARQLFMPAATWASAQQASEIVQTARSAYQALPREARGPVTTAMYAWVKTFVNSAEFKAAYERHRIESKPQPLQVDGTVEQEIKRRIDRQLKELDEMKEGLGSMPADQRKNMEAVIAAQRTSFTSPEFAASQRADIERDRAQGKASYEAGMKEWPTAYPADFQVWVARQLREFLDATATVDFTVKWNFFEGIPVSSSPTAKGTSWQWAESSYAGKEATTAARAAAEAWLKEIGAK